MVSFCIRCDPGCWSEQNQDNITKSETLREPIGGSFQPLWCSACSKSAPCLDRKHSEPCLAKQPNKIVSAEQMDVVGDGTPPLLFEQPGLQSAGVRCHDNTESARRHQPTNVEKEFPGIRHMFNHVREVDRCELF